MARIYDVVCLSCGEIFWWCKYDPPEERCPNCGEKLTTEDGDWDFEKAMVFGVGSSSREVRELSEAIKAGRRQKAFCSSPKVN